MPFGFPSEGAFSFTGIPISILSRLQVRSLRVAGQTISTRPWWPQVVERYRQYTSRMTAHFEVSTGAYGIEMALEQNREPGGRPDALLPSPRYMHLLGLFSSGAGISQLPLEPHHLSTREWSFPGTEDQFFRP